MGPHPLTPHGTPPTPSMGPHSHTLTPSDDTWHRLILDTPDHEHDKRLAEHVAYVHRYEEHPPLEFETFDAPFMRAMISHARYALP